MRGPIRTSRPGPPVFRGPCGPVGPRGRTLPSPPSAPAMPRSAPLRALLLAGVSLLALSCGGDGPTGPDPAVVVSVTVTPSSATLTEGETLPLSATALNGLGEPAVGATVSWSSSAPGVASVSAAGVVTAVAPGTASVTATAGGRSASAAVTVRPSPPAAPTGLTVEALSSTEVRLGWTDASDDEAGFEVERATVTGGSAGPAAVVATVGAGTTSFTDDGLDPATTYRYRVRAIKADTASAWAGPVDVTTRSPLAVEAGTLATAALNVPYADTLVAIGGDGSYTWARTGGTLPAGLALSAAGVVSGTPTEVGTFVFQATVTSDGVSVSGSFELSVTDDAPPLVLQTSSLPDGAVGTEYAATLSASGGVAPVAWSVVGGELPPGIVLNPDSGELVGEPSQAGTFGFTAQASSADGQTATAQLSIQVEPGPVTVVTRELPAGEDGRSYSVSLVAEGGDGVSYAWSVQGSLPPGLVLDPTGVFVGTPGVDGSFAVTVRVESGGRVTTRDLILTIVPPPAPGYRIDLAYLSPVSATHRAAFENARARWEGIITADVPDLGQELPGCGGFHPPTEAFVDDLVIYVTVDSIDGPAGTLGQAGPCYFRDSWLSLSGAMTFDEADLDNLAANGLLEEVVLHEMGHVLGSGVTWRAQDLLAGECLGDPRFIGAGAVQAFLDADGNLYSGEPVPVENTGTLDDGSNCSHWRESVLGTELMTPFIQLGSNPLSAITIQSLGDQGYTVDPSRADAYVLPKPVPAGAPARADGVWLHDDVLRIPPLRVGPDGRIEQIGGRR